MTNKSSQVRAYIAGKELEKFRRGDKTYHRVKSIWKWYIEHGGHFLLGFKEREDAEFFIKKYLC